MLQEKRQIFWNIENSLIVRVPSELREKAEALIRKGRLDFTDEPEDQRIMELPDSQEADRRSAVEKHQDLGDGYPEDATVEVCFEKVPERTWMIELSLRENRIHTRTDVMDDGSRRVFVMPDDEPMAREIVREIEEGLRTDVK